MGGNRQQWKVKKRQEAVPESKNGTTLVILSLLLLAVRPFSPSHSADLSDIPCIIRKLSIPAGSRVSTGSGRL